MPSLRIPKILNRKADRPSLKARAATLKASAARVLRRKIASAHAWLWCSARLSVLLGTLEPPEVAAVHRSLYGLPAGGPVGMAALPQAGEPTGAVTND